jgi:hypothetical protein
VVVIVPLCRRFEEVNLSMRCLIDHNLEPALEWPHSPRPAMASPAALLSAHPTACWSVRMMIMIRIRIMIMILVLLELALGVACQPAISPFLSTPHGHGAGAVMGVVVGMVMMSTRGPQIREAWWGETRGHIGLADHGDRGGLSTRPTMGPT